MKCKKCNNKISSYAKFCVGCGEPVVFEMTGRNYFGFMKKIGLDNVLKLSVIVGVVILSFSVAYFFVYRPIKLDIAYKKCLALAREGVGGELLATDSLKINLEICSRTKK